MEAKVPDIQPNPYIMPMGAPVGDPTQWQARQAKLREWQAQNPSRVIRGQMGRNASNAVNYDASVYGSDYSGGPAAPAGGYAGGYGPVPATPANTVQRGSGPTARPLNGPGVGVNQPAPNTTATSAFNPITGPGRVNRGGTLDNGRGPFRP